MHFQDINNHHESRSSTGNGSISRTHCNELNHQRNITDLNHSSLRTSSISQTTEQLPHAQDSYSSTSQIQQRRNPILLPLNHLPQEQNSNLASIYIHCPNNSELTLLEVQQDVMPPAYVDDALPTYESLFQTDGEEIITEHCTDPPPSYDVLKETVV